MKIKGKIEKIFFASEKEWASILVTNISIKDMKKKKCSYLNTSLRMSGKILNPIIGADIEADGDIVLDKKYGLEFKAEKSKICLVDNNAIKTYLCSYIKGIGDITAEKIIDKFGKKTIDIIENDYQRLAEIKGISPKKAESIHMSHEESHALLKLVEFFNGKITMNQANKIIETYGSLNKAMDMLKNNPYDLIYNIKGFGFKIVDRLALNSGIKPDAPERLKAGIEYTLTEISNMQGHCYIYIDDLYKYVKDIIPDANVKPEVLVKELHKLIKEGRIIYEDERIYLRDLYNDECSIANKILILLSNKKRDIKGVGRSKRELSKIEDENGFKFEESQIDAVENSLTNNFSLITGGPGTGKSTIINVIAHSCSCEVVLLAPTGRASKRLKEVTGMPAMTIAKYIYSRKGMEDNSVENTMFIVDEASMIDLDTASSLMRLLDKSCRICFVGDTDQLPPIGAGNFFRDLINCYSIPKTVLNVTHRFGGLIAENANYINNGNGSLKTGAAFEIKKELDTSKRGDMIIDEYVKELKKYKNDYSRVQIIVPQRQRGDTCTNQLNSRINKILNPVNDYISDNIHFKFGDRVMFTQNAKDGSVCNGDCGVIKRYDEETKELVIETDEHKTILFDTRYIENLVLAYAITVHKAQGSEYSTVISAYGTNDFIMLQRNLLYTAVTRAKNKIVIITDNKAIPIAVRNIKPINRNTSLKERIETN